jgi:cyclase
MTLFFSVMIAWGLMTGLVRTAQAQPGTTKQIVPGVWLWWADPKAGITDNEIVIEMADYLIVVDANMPLGARLFLADLKKISSKPIKYVVDTHFHEDHIYGNVLFTKLGATTIASIALVEELKEYEPANWQLASKHRKDVAELNLPGPEPPLLAYTQSQYVISDSSRRVELHHFGWGHTRGDTFVYLPKEKVLCTGDAVPNGPHSDPANAWIRNWANEVAGALKLDVKYVLPAHGGPGGKELLEQEHQFLVELYQAVQAAIRSGKTLGELVTIKDGRPVETSIQLSKGVMEASVLHGTIAGRFATQVYDTYQEITQGKPWGEIAGPTEHFKPITHQ